MVVATVAGATLCSTGWWFLLRLIPIRDFRLLWSAGVVSQLGDWSARLALALLVLDRTGNAALVGVVGVLFVIPWLGIGQTLTAWSSRYGRKQVLVTCDAFRGAAFIAIGFGSLPTVLLLVLVFFAAMADPVFEATKSAFVTEIVPKDDYAEAIKVTHAANQASALFGYAIGGVLVSLVGEEATLVLNGATFLLSALLVVFVRRSGVQKAADTAKNSLAAGIAYLRHDRISAVAFVATVMLVATGMSVESQVAVYGTTVAGFGERTIGLLSAISPAATLVAVALVKTKGDDRQLLRRGLATAAIAALLASLLLFMGADGVMAFVAFALVGTVFGFVTLTNVVVGRRLPDENRVGIFSILQSGVFLGISVGTLGGGLLSDATSPEVAAGSALLVGVFALVAALPYVRKPGRHSMR